MSAGKSKKTPSFEEALKKLETIVTALENGDTPLSDLVEHYKEGLYYKQICQDYLDQAELILEELDEKGEAKPLIFGEDKG